VDLIEFLDSLELELPGSWDTHAGSFEQLLETRFLVFLKRLRSVDGPDYLTRRVRGESDVASSLCEGLVTCLSEYLRGQPPKAFTVLTKTLSQVEPCFKAMYSKDNVATELKSLYRIRLSTAAVLDRQEIFHVPFERRHLVATARYSIPGLPCLYLGGSAYACWLECNKPPLGSVHLSRFQPASGCALRILDFGWRPAQIAALVHSGRYRHQLSMSSVASDLVVAHALCWPLLAACSTKVRYSDAGFKPEYIVPQLLLQWITSETNIDGIRYFTTKEQRYIDDPVPTSNFAFPVRTTKSSGFCDRLSARFELSSPVSWPSVSALAPAIGAAPHTRFDVGTPPTPYNATELGRLQHWAAALPCAML
jgi:hypothetical protein